MGRAVPAVLARSSAQRQPVPDVASFEAAIAEIEARTGRPLRHYTWTAPTALRDG